MNRCNLIGSAARELDSISLFPHMTFGISLQNKKTGEITGPKSVSFSFSTTLLRMMMAIFAAALLLKGAFCLWRWKEMCALKRKARKKNRKKRFAPKKK